MKKLEKLKLIPADDKQKERLVRWLYEWNLFLTSTNTDDDVSDIADTSSEYQNILSNRYITPFDENFESGQIRLMSPGADENMLFIVITSVFTDGTIEFIPFSLLTEPATPDELLSGRKNAVVAVYCLWNFRKVQKDMVGNSWIVDQLTDIEIKRLLQAFNAYKQNGTPPDDLRPETGPPLIHPEDPRRKYKNYERQRVNTAISNTSNNIFHYEMNSEQELPKAAEESTPYEP